MEEIKKICEKLEKNKVSNVEKKFIPKSAGNKAFKRHNKKFFLKTERRKELGKGNGKV